MSEPPPPRASGAGQDGRGRAGTGGDRRGPAGTGGGGEDREGQGMGGWFTSPHIESEIR